MLLLSWLSLVVMKGYLVDERDESEIKTTHCKRHVAATEALIIQHENSK